MAMAIQVETTGRENIKPSSPTPPDLKILKLSLLDQFIPITYTSIVLFFPLNQDANATEVSHKLKTSLSETLTRFFPLAGRLKDNASIDCNDQGAEFIQARVGCLLLDILENPDVQVLKNFLPAAIESPEAATGNLLLVQASFFDCGGLAIGVCISHKMADAATLTTFIKCWATTAANRAGEVVVSPVFMGASVFPPIDMSVPMTPLELMTQTKCITQRFVFHASKIAALRAKVASTSVPDPSRVEAVSGLLWKGVMTAVRSNFKVFRPSVWSISVNLRTRFVPPLPETFAGNCVGFIGPKMEDEHGDELDLKELVCRIRKEMEEFGEKYVRRIQEEGVFLAICGFAKEFGDMAMSKDIDFYVCTSWCKYDLYGADFGWGKPVWLSSTSTKVRNVAVLMDTRDGNGIEAWLTLDEEDMQLLESNQELLEFAAINPSVA